MPTLWCGVDPISITRVLWHVDRGMKQKNAIIGNMLPKLDSCRYMKCFEVFLSFSNNSSFIYQGNVNSLQNIKYNCKTKEHLIEFAVQLIDFVLFSDIF